MKAIKIQCSTCKKYFKPVGQLSLVWIEKDMKGTCRSCYLKHIEKIYGKQL